MTTGELRAHWADLRYTARQSPLEPAMPVFSLANSAIHARARGALSLADLALVAGLLLPWGASAQSAAKPPAEGRAQLAARLMQSAPYRVEIASSDGSKLLITNGLTLERRRLLEKKGLTALAFSPDGAWLYAVTSAGEAWAVDPDGGKILLVGTVPVASGDVVVDAMGLGPADQLAVQVVLARGGPATKGCANWTAPRRVVLRKGLEPGAQTRMEARPGWPEDRRSPRLAAISPNTRIKAAVIGPILQGEGRFGAASGQISRSALPMGTFAIEWMRDSAGVAVYYPKAAARGCKYRLGLRSFRSDDGKGWTEWTLPDGVELQRGDQPWVDASVAPDGMRWLATDARGVVLVEPLPRFRGKVALVAPTSVIAPKLRPGVRALPSLVGGSLRLAELLLETGDLDAAAAELALQEGKAAPAELVTLRKRLTKLEEVRERRAAELGLSLDDLRSAKGTPVAPARAATAPEDDAVEPAAAATPSAGPASGPAGGSPPVRAP